MLQSWKERGIILMAAVKLVAQHCFCNAMFATWERKRRTTVVAVKALFHPFSEEPSLRIRCWTMTNSNLIYLVYMFLHERWANYSVFEWYSNSWEQIVIFVFIFVRYFQTEYYSYSYSDDFSNPNSIRIRLRIRLKFCIRIQPYFWTRIVFIFAQISQTE